VSYAAYHSIATFLQTLDREVPVELDAHLVLDNSSTHKTPAIKRWLTAHPRFVLHFTPTGSSWLNLLERWFAELTSKAAPRRAPLRPRTQRLHQCLDHDPERRPALIRAPVGPDVADD
jgi:transposase